MDTQSMNAGAGAANTDPANQTGAGLNPADPTLNASASQQAQGLSASVVPDHVIPAELPHPTTLGTPLARGVKYLHHFELLLVSDGRRLWAAASAEGKAVLAAIEGEKQTDQDAIAAHRAGAAKEPAADDPMGKGST